MAQTKTLKKLRDVKDTERFGDHVNAIMFALRNGPLTREKVVAAVGKRLEGKTVMTPSAIVSFQAPRMVERGLISVTVEGEKGAAKPKAKKAEKPAPKPKAKKAEKPKAKKQKPAPEAAPATDDGATVDAAVDAAGAE